ncbi:MAG: hypothetical protein HY775_06820 [Acidobacteria bacterium]|nr:hypothetical protein [Acidobacteriota bacterium]
MRLLAAVACASLALGACAGAGGNRSLGAGTPSGAGTASTAPAPAHPGAAPPGVSATPRSTARATGTAAASSPTERPALPVALTLSASCASPGDTMKATVETEPGAALGFTAVYNDDDYQPDISFVPRGTNPSATYVWTWALRPDVPLGDAAVQVLASGKRASGTARAPFRVARTC